MEKEVLQLIEDAKGIIRKAHDLGYFNYHANDSEAELNEKDFAQDTLWKLERFLSARS